MPVYSKHSVLNCDEAYYNFISSLTTYFLENNYYVRKSEITASIKEMLKNIDPLFAAKAAVYMRKKYYIRNISFFIAIEILSDTSGKKWAKDFFADLVEQPDDMLDIASLIIEKKIPIPNSVKKGFAKAFREFDGYQLLKFSGKNKNFKLRDLINLLHLKRADSNKEAFSSIMFKNKKVIDFDDENNNDNKELVKKIFEMKFT